MLTRVVARWEASGVTALGAEGTPRGVPSWGGTRDGAASGSFVGPWRWG